MNLWGVLGLFLTAGIGIWKFWRHFSDEKRKRAEAAQKIIEGGIKSGDTSSITSALDRLNR